METPSRRPQRPFTSRKLSRTLSRMDRRKFLQGTAATAAFLSTPRLSFAAQTDLQPVFSEVEKRHDETVKRLQTSI